ncbi:hypothetical protein B0H11DRAFT_2316758 [Mycena galericulata]|nr:hypothetical protein B0H11DRAFT_2316758 [Mycena galericulata]
MRTSSSIALPFLLAAGAMASAHQARSGNHHAIAMRANNSTVRALSQEKRDTYDSKEMTWYPTDTGPDACTGKNHQDSDYYVAMGYNQFGDGSGCCGRQLKIDYNGKSAVATCVDECASCPEWGQIDLTKGLFEFFTGDLGIGVFYGSWSYVEGGGDDSTTTTSTKKATTTHTTATHTSTQVEKAEAAPAPTTHSTSTKHSSSSAKPSSSKKASSSSAKHSSSSAHLTTSSAAAPTTASAADTGAVGNVGSDAGAGAGEGEGADTSSAIPVAGALTGSHSGAAPLGRNTLGAALAVLVLAAVQAL